ncbi:hypothetical protein Glove_606g150 [Diversispora epigaea]|uniref:Tc1-like transposase DDE domain-containing protein n=1 Tax=Diversispora epigaea TaxID=1348612 RepID=A0A397G9X7_9GLOM|nr:hypothetical protein Glove_606g150 [Diversispora epigaea]
MGYHGRTALKKSNITQWWRCYDVGGVFLGKRGYLFQQDNAPIHASVATQNFMQEISLLPWLRQSPDLNTT